MICQCCQGKHPTVIHSDMEDRINKQKEQPTHAITQPHKYLNPGKIPQEEKMVCFSFSLNHKNTFLDPGSYANFCSKNFKKKLNAKGLKMELLLKTMVLVKPVTTLEINHLEIVHIGVGIYLTWPKVYTQRTIPVSKFLHHQWPE